MVVPPCCGRGRTKHFAPAWFQRPRTRRRDFVSLSSHVHPAHLPIGMGWKLSFRRALPNADARAPACPLRWTVMERTASRHRSQRAVSARASRRAMPQGGEPLCVMIQHRLRCSPFLDFLDLGGRQAEADRHHFARGANAATSVCKIRAVGTVGEHAGILAPAAIQGRAQTCCPTGRQARVAHLSDRHGVSAHHLRRPPWPQAGAARGLPEVRTRIGHHWHRTEAAGSPDCRTALPLQCRDERRSLRRHRLADDAHPAGLDAAAPAAPDPPPAQADASCARLWHGRIGRHNQPGERLSADAAQARTKDWMKDQAG